MLRRALLILVLLSVGSIAGGCATAGLAVVSPVIGSLAAIADRSVERTLPADISTTWGATVDAMARMGVRLDEVDKSKAKWQLTGSGEAVTVHGALERVTAGMTKLSVRVEAGGLFADKHTSDELLNQVAASLASLASADRRDRASDREGSGEQLRLLHQEIERLGAKIEQARERASPTTRPGASSMPAASPMPIIVIPTSAGVETVPLPGRTLVPRTVPSGLSHRAVTRDDGPRGGLHTAEGRERRAGDIADDIVAAPMRSVEILRPVGALQVRPAGE